MQSSQSWKRTPDKSIILLLHNMKTNIKTVTQELLEYTTNKYDIYYTLYSTLNEEERKELASELNITPIFNIWNK